MAKKITEATPTVELIPAEEHIYLFLTDESSNKAYNVHLVPAAEAEGWLINFEYGKRGSALRSNTKTKSPLPFAQAKKEYDKIVRGQLKDGYTTDESGAVYQNTGFEERFTGILGQLLNSIEEEEVERIESLLEDEGWGLQEKHDGERRLAKVSSSEVIGINKQGLACAVTMDMEKVLKALGPCVIDSEDMGDHFAVFDLLEVGEGEQVQDLRGLPYKERYKRLEALLQAAPSKRLRGEPLRLGSTAKRELLAKVKVRQGEGVVFKKLDAPFSVGRPASGGTQLKLKFCAEATLVVDKVHPTKRSVAVVGLDEAGVRIALGSVTVPSNQEMPAVGDLIEVRYLYAFKGGKLFQPRMKMFRKDQTLADCGLAQLKYKAPKAAHEDLDELSQEEAQQLTTAQPSTEVKEMVGEAVANATKPRKMRT